MPEPDEQTQRQYLDYLKLHLAFPFQASAPDSEESETIQVFAFAEPPIDPDDGILCVGSTGKHESYIPLSNIEVEEDDPNFQYIEDYADWSWEAAEFEDDE